MPLNPPDRDTKASLHPLAMYYPTYQYDNFFYTAFLPDRLEFPRGVLRCLAPTKSSFPVVQSTEGPEAGTFRLHPALLQEWKDLAFVVDPLQDVVGTYVWKSGHLFPLTLKRPAPMRSYQYDVAFETEHALRASAIRVRAGFIHNLAFISYLVACLAKPTQDPTGDPIWVQDAITRGVLGPTVYNCFRDTWVFDLNARRRGAFVDITKCTRERGRNPMVHRDSPHPRSSFRTSLVAAVSCNRCSSRFSVFAGASVCVLQGCGTRRLG